MSKTITVALPMPPSLWRLYEGKGKRQQKSKEYKSWIKEAGWLLVQQRNSGGTHRRILGDVSISIRAYKHGNKRRDLDNILKAPLDLLTSTHTIKDDSQVVSIHAQWVDSGVPCELTVRECA